MAILYIIYIIIKIQKNECDVSLGSHQVNFQPWHNDP